MVLSPECGVYMPERFLDIAEEIYNFEVRPTDIWIVTFPKSGTTVIQVRTLPPISHPGCISSAELGKIFF